MTGYPESYNRSETHCGALTLHNWDQPVAQWGWAFIPLPWESVMDFVNFPEKTNKFEQNYYSMFIDLSWGVYKQDTRVVNFSIMCYLLLGHRQNAHKR